MQSDSYKIKKTQKKVNITGKNNKIDNFWSKHRCTRKIWIPLLKI